MQTKTYRELQNKEQFFDFCQREAQEQEKNASMNMWSDDWKNKNNTLPYILENTSRFDGTSGEFFILFDGDVIVACGGVYVSEFNNQITNITSDIRKEISNIKNEIAKINTINQKLSATLTKLRKTTHRKKKTEL